MDEHDLDVGNVEFHIVPAREAPVVLLLAIIYSSELCFILSF